MKSLEAEASSIWLNDTRVLMSAARGAVDIDVTAGLHATIETEPQKLEGHQLPYSRVKIGDTDITFSIHRRNLVVKIDAPDDVKIRMSGSNRR